MAFLQFDADTHTYTVGGKKLPSVTEICGLLNNWGDLNPAILRQAARRGSVVHEYAELIDYGCNEDGIEVEPELSGYALAWMHFCRDYRPEWEMIEQKLYSESQGFAGTLDRFGTIDGKPVIVDIKTSSSINRAARINWACQLSAYALLLDKEQAPGRWNVVLKKDGKYTIIDSIETEERYAFSGLSLFTTLLHVWKIVNE